MGFVKDEQRQAVFGKVCRVYLVIGARITFLGKCNLFLYTAGANVSLVTRLDAAEPGSLAPVDTPNVEIITS